MSFDPPERDAIERGDEGPTVTVEGVRREDFVRYAGASGDFNPLHYDDEYVREAGYDGVFGQGMLVAGVMSRVITQWFGIEPVSTFDVRFTGKVYPGESIRASGVIEDLEETTECHRLTLGLTAETDDGTTVATGTATIALGKNST